MTRVILCLIRPLDDRNDLVTTQTLVSVFRRFGVLSDVRIFERRVLVKAFIEFEDASTALLALKKVGNGNQSFGSLKVYPSKKNRIMRTSSAPFTEDLSQDNLGKELPNPGPLQTGRGSNLPTWPIFRFSDQSYVNGFERDGAQNDHTLKHAITYHSEIPTSLGGFSLEETSVFPPFLSSTTDNSRRVVIVNRLSSDRITHTHLIALFSCYGSVIKILINSSMNYALVEFSSHTEAAVAATCLKTIRLFGCLLKSKISKYASLNFRTLERDTSNSLKHFYADPSTLANKTALTGRPHPPSAFIEVHGCSTDLTPLLISLLVSDIHVPQQVLVRGPSNDPYFCIAFASTEQALDVLASLDRQQVNNRRLAIAFSKGPSSGL
jgi:hypothetical protein